MCNPISQKTAAIALGIGEDKFKSLTKIGHFDNYRVYRNGVFIGIDPSLMNDLDKLIYVKQKTCAKCNAPMHISRFNSSLYCSDECKNDSLIKICLECGIEFKPKYKQFDKFCSKRCSGIHSRPKKTLKPTKPKQEKKGRAINIHACAHCTKNYSCGEGWRNTYYCSDKCRSEHYKRVCGNCGESFVSKKPAKYCSRSCAFEVAQSVRLLKEYKICNYCSGEYYGIKEQKFCCDVCRYLSSQESLNDLK